MAAVLAAPPAAVLLGDAEAEVIKIETPSMPDGLRSWGVMKDTGIQPNHEVLFKIHQVLLQNHESRVTPQAWFRAHKLAVIVLDSRSISIIS